MLKTKDYKIKTTYWFTLIELLIAVWLSTLLMTSIMIFVGSSIWQSKKNEKILSYKVENFNFDNNFLNTIENISWSGLIHSWSNIWEYLSWYFFSSNWDNLIDFIWLKSLTWYCDKYWETASGSGEIKILELIKYNWTLSNTWTSNYKIDFSSHSIVSSTWNLIVWTWLKWYKFDTNPLKTELSNPSAIIEQWDYLYIADTGNSRILVYNKLDSTISILADKYAWINKPNDLYIHWNKLYISNAWNGEILEIEDWYWTWSKLDINFISEKNITINKIRFTFDWISNIANPSNSWSFTFSWFNKWSEDTINIWDSLEYYFSWSNITLNSWTNYWIKINNISPAPTTKWSYSVKIEFINWTDIKYVVYRPYLIIWDWYLYTNLWNTINTLSENIPFPNSLNWNSGNIKWKNEIEDYTEILSNSWYIKKQSVIPIENFEVIKNEDVLTFKIKYYWLYDCINWKHAIKERVIKKNP